MTTKKKTLFNVDKKDWKDEVNGKAPYLWDVQLETLVVMFALRLKTVRGISDKEVRKIIRDINYKYVSTGRNGVKGKLSNYVATQWQRLMLINKSKTI